MPAGTYAIVDEEGRSIGAESFRCAPGPMGWRYVSEIETSDPEPHHETVDLVADAAWRPVRIRVETGAHSLLLQREDGRLVGHRDGEPLELAFGDGVELDYLSPAFNAVTAARLGGTAEFDVWYFEPVAIEPVEMRQRYEQRGVEVVATPAGRFEATRWGFASLDTGYESEFWLAGDVVVRYAGLYELETYEAGASGVSPMA
jgi:Putative glycolipid-binding